MIRETSLEAYEEIKGKLGERQQQVYEHLRWVGEATNNMISASLKLPINSITPRVFELRQKKLVGVSKIDKCLMTGRNAIYWKIIVQKRIEEK